jgi:Tfp pilus assembly protein PilO
MLKGTEFGRFRLEVFPAEKKKSVGRRHDKDGFEQVKTIKQKNAQKKLTLNPPQLKQQQHSIEKQFKAKVKQRQKAQEVASLNKKVTTTNAFSALDDSDE